ncbi:MAG TPA: hypothetical protein VKR22_02610 [Acidimicrobiales bacterium]|nr:hypothetical protein [Acidimicrobiales bacterium]
MSLGGLARATAAFAVAGGLLAACGGPTVTVTSGHGPGSRFACRLDTATQAITGAFGTASAIGWEGNNEGVVTCLGGSFFVQNGINRSLGFGIYDGSRTDWTDLNGYLPAQTTSFSRNGAQVAITEFADRVVIGGDPYVVLYCRVAVVNRSPRAATLDPDPSPGLVELLPGPDVVAPHGTAFHDYVMAIDRFGANVPWPSAAALVSAGSFTEHLGHMARFWDAQLSHIAALDVPDQSLVDAYKSGFIFTQIARSGNRLDTGVNGYAQEFNHDVVGILANLFTQGEFADAHALLLEARNVVGSEGGLYADGTWTYAWPWAIYLMKTGDVAFVRQNFGSSGSASAPGPSIEATAHQIAADRTGPGGIMKRTDDIDTDGYWTVDDYEALTGLAAYRYLAERLGDQSESQWAASQYDSLLAATNTTLAATISRDGLDYLPCSLLEPNTANRCNNPLDANWAAPFEFGKWATEAPVFGSAVSGPGIDLIDSTYQYGFDRAAGMLPPDTFGGFPSDWYSSAYNAAYGTWALAGSARRDQGIVGYQFMVRSDESGPNSWWESSTSPDPASPWIGTHPGGGQGSSPHAWGMAQANQVLLDSLVAQHADGSLVVGRGLPAEWLAAGDVVSVRNFPTIGGHRIDVRISSTGQAVSLDFGSGAPAGPVLFQLPDFVGNIAGASSGTVDEASGTVTIDATTGHVTVQLRHPPAA